MIETKLFSIVLGCYGNYPNYSIRAAQSVLNTTEKKFNFHVGCNSCCSETIQFMREQADAGRIDTLVESKWNLNKDPMMRMLLETVQTPYILWMDDDSYVSGDWSNILNNFIERERFDCAGHVFFCHKKADYNDFLRRRPWWRGDEYFLEPDHLKVVWFATGGMFLIRTEILREHNFPDRGMVKRQDDLLLGDLISQWHLRLINFPREFMDVIRISDGNRRGSGEGNDGWIQ